jgi:polyisoprenoid-binding protein YceI
MERRRLVPKQWQFDRAHSSINFSVRHMVVSKVRGRFTRWTGVLVIDDVDSSRSSVLVEIDATSIDTGDPVRDTHLLANEFLCADRFPRLTFRSTLVEPISTGYQMTGDLTIRGITRSVVLHVEDGGRVRDPRGYDRVGFSAHTAINRNDFGIWVNMVIDLGGLALSERVDIDIDIEAIRTA